MKKYTPNFNDPRVKRKCRSALQWATSQLHEYKYRTWCRKQLDLRIGRSHSQLGKWLRNQLLVTHSAHYNMHTGQTKSYVLNVHGAAKLAQNLGIEYKRSKPRQSIGTQLCIQHYQPLFQQNTFEYTKRSNRLYNEMQNIKTDVRKNLFAHYGFIYNYDIANAYPTLMLQYAKNRANFRTPLTAIEQYTQDPKGIRHSLAQQINCDYATAKHIMIAKFNGGTTRIHSSIWHALTTRQLYLLKHSTTWQQLNQDITRMWRGISRSNNQSNYTAPQRMHTYLCEERRVMKCVEDIFSHNHTRIFLEHDGWRSQHLIDTQVIEQHIKNKTGYTVQITCEELR